MIGHTAPETLRRMRRSEAMTRQAHGQVRGLVLVNVSPTLAERPDAVGRTALISPQLAW